MKTKNRKQKIRIESIYVQAIADDCPDTSFLGKYSDRAELWSIDRKKNDFVAKIEQRERIIEALRDRITIADEEQKITVELIAKTEKRIEKIEQSYPHESVIDRNEYRYFAPYAGGEKTGTKEYREYAWQDYKRMEGLNSGNWCFIGIVAKADILIPCLNQATKQSFTQCQTITSGGLWGIESDLKDYENDVAQDELSNLKDQLLQLGIDKQEVAKAANRWDGVIEYK